MQIINYSYFTFAYVPLPHSNPSCTSYMRHYLAMLSTDVLVYYGGYAFLTMFVIATDSKLLFVIDDS